MKKIFFSLAIALFFAIGLQAQSKEHHSGDKTAHRHHHKNPELRKELRQHYENNIYPVLKTEHDIFDAALNSDDLNFLKGKRAEAAKIHADRKDLRQQIRAAIKGGLSKEDAKTQFSGQMEDLKNRRKAITESLEPFIEKNQSLIDQTTEKLKPYHEQWKTERKTIHEKYNPDGVAKGDEIRKHHAEHSKNPEKGKGFEKVEKRRNAKVIHFLLWDGEMNNGEMGAENDQNVDLPPVIENGLNYEEDYELSASPNPATSETNISFELPSEADVVNITLSDFNGNILREIPMKNLSPGLHSVQLNLDGIAKGKYVVGIHVDGRVVSSTLLIQ